jgi:hypothetical protein
MLLMQYIQSNGKVMHSKEVMWWRREIRDAAMTGSEGARDGN